LTANEQLGANVRAVRTSRGLTQEQVAFDTGLHLSFVSDIERGKRNISVQTLLKLARALGVAAPALLEGVALDGDSGQPAA
jgi:transcriptional regulator with XRE-family HTH domain